jgi:hypothetical protein
MPGAGRVDHRVGLDCLGAFAVLIADFEWRRFAAFGLELVEARPADAVTRLDVLNVRLERGLLASGSR